MALPIHQARSSAIYAQPPIGYPLTRTSTIRNTELTLILQMTAWRVASMLFHFDPRRTCDQPRFGCIAAAVARSTPFAGETLHRPANAGRYCCASFQRGRTRGQHTLPLGQDRP